MSGKFVLDACAVIAFFNDEDGADKVEQLLWQGERAPNSLFKCPVLRCYSYRIEAGTLTDRKITS